MKFSLKRIFVIFTIAAIPLFFISKVLKTTNSSWDWMSFLEPLTIYLWVIGLQDEFQMNLVKPGQSHFFSMFCGVLLSCMICTIIIISFIALIQKLWNWSSTE